MKSYTSTISRVFCKCFQFTFFVTQFRRQMALVHNQKKILDTHSSSGIWNVCLKTFWKSTHFFSIPKVLLIYATTRGCWRIKQHVRQTISPANMSIQVIFVFENFLAELANVIGGFGVDKYHVTSHVNPLLREFAT